MGLDQYLTRYNTLDEEAVEVAYWRKANWLHAWIEDDLNGGESTNCEEIIIDLEQLAGLRKTCQTVINHPELAEDLLPTCSGFFFGGTEYDDYYFKELQQTIDAIDAVMADEMEQSKPGSRRYVYYSWW